MKRFVFLSLLAFLPALTLGQDLEKELQTQMIMVEDGETIRLPEGRFSFKGSLWMDGKKNITIRGAGKDKTFLSWKGQTDGAEGLKITNSEGIVLEDFTAQDAKGDLIKTQHVKGLTFRRVRAEWTGEPKETNGAYALYPVQSSQILIEECEAIGASDAGIYVGQSDQVIVRKSRAYRNVAGIEIENTTRAEVYDNLAEGNTGGILVFDLPGLTKKDGGFTRVYNNLVRNNNYRNFAPKGNMVGQVPAGSGMMILAANQTEIFNNKIEGHKTVGIGVVSYFITELPIKDETYDPYSWQISIYNNTFSRTPQFPDTKNKLGKLFLLKFRKHVPDVLYDGILDAKKANGTTNPMQICMQNNGKATFANLDAANRFKGLSKDIKPFTCSLPALPPSTF